jgi:hypothetical protein
MSGSSVGDKSGSSVDVAQGSYVCHGREEFIANGRTAVDTHDTGRFKRSVTFVTRKPVPSPSGQGARTGLFVSSTPQRIAQGVPQDSDPDEVELISMLSVSLPSVEASHAHRSRNDFPNRRMQQCPAAPQRIACSTCGNRCNLQPDGQMAPACRQLSQL